jgi:hypothetical protein
MFLAVFVIDETEYRLEADVVATSILWSLVPRNIRI